MTGIVKFVTGYGYDSIRRVEVLRETAVSVFLSRNPSIGNQKTERRESKTSPHCQYHDSWEAAHKYLIKKADAEVTAARRQLEKAAGKLGNIKGMPVGKVLK